MKIYTRTGDKGQTSLLGGKRVLKSSLRVETYGTVDELNSVIGVAVAEQGQKYKEEINDELERIQRDLFSIGARLANPQGKPVEGLQSRVDDFEKLIDALTDDLPQLRHFILPGGTEAGAHLHLARTISRRAERRLVELSQGEDVDEDILKYLNRLSDLLFTMARYVNHKAKQPETIWKG